MKKIKKEKYPYIANGLRKSSFTLIEVAIYLSLLLLIVFIFSNFVKNIREFSVLSSKISDNILKKNLFADVIKRDLISASSKKLDWNEDKFIFKKYFLNSKDEPDVVCIGYEIRKNSLFRIEGRYDFLNSKWNKRISSFVAPDFESFNLKLHKIRDRVISVEVECKFHKLHEPKNIFTRLRNI